MLEKTGLMFIAIFSGVLLALMINVNAELAASSSPIQASWLAHGIGSVVAFVLFVIFKDSGKTVLNSHLKKRYWFGGIPGAFTVILASITVQSEIGLTGTLALALFGQFFSSLLIEHFGLLNQQRIQLSLKGLLPTVLVATGAMIIIFARAGGL